MRMRWLPAPRSAACKAGTRAQPPDARITLAQIARWHARRPAATPASSTLRPAPRDFFAAVRAPPGALITRVAGSILQRTEGALRQITRGMRQLTSAAGRGLPAPLLERVAHRLRQCATTSAGGACRYAGRVQRAAAGVGTGSAGTRLRVGSRAMAHGGAAPQPAAGGRARRSGRGRRCRTHRRRTPEPEHGVVRGVPDECRRQSRPGSTGYRLIFSCGVPASAPAPGSRRPCRPRWRSRS